MAGKFSAPQASPDVQTDYMKKKQAMEEAFIEFHKIFTDKLLDKNKSVAVKKTEVSIVDKLMKTCNALEQVNVGEGLMALAIISLREQLTLKDRVNELEYELLKALRTINELTGKKAEPKN